MDHQTFAQLMGNYGEFVSAVAVVATLAYLGIQVRQNTRQLQRAEFNSTLEQANAVRRIRIEGEFATLLARITDAPEQELSTEDKIRLYAYYSMEMWQHLNMWDRIRAGIIEAESYAFDSVTRSLLGHGTGQRWWAQNQVYFEQKFVDSINRVLEGGDQKHGERQSGG